MTAIIIAGLALLAFSVLGQSPCTIRTTTTANNTGKCIPFKRCSHTLAGITTCDDLEDDLVCCSTEVTNDCVTFEGNAGTCVDIQSCPSLTSLLNPPTYYSSRNMDYVKNHRCDDKNENRVCCINCKKVLGPPHPRTGCCGIGRSNETPDPNKVATAIDQYPWLALIYFKGLGHDEYYKCAGNLISSKYVLTAAQCFKPSEFSFMMVIVRLGEYDTSRNGPDCVETDDGRQECTDGAISIPVDIIIPHHGYTLEKGLHDIALLKLKYDAPYTDFIRPICLPSSDIDEDELPTLYAAGWGSPRTFHRSSNVKLQVDLPIVPLKECTVLWEDMKVTPIAAQICAGGDVGKSTCNGDAGGPLMLYNGFYELVGIISIGGPCGKRYPDIFTKVYNYLPWIRSHIDA